MECPIHHIKFEMLPGLCEFLILFSIVKLKLVHNFKNSCIYSKLGLLDVVLSLHVQVFPNLQRE